MKWAMTAFLGVIAWLAIIMGRQSAPSVISKPITSATQTQLRDWVLQPPLVEEDQKTNATLRIVSAAPSATEICCALGLREKLVGRTRYCDYPPDVQNVPSIGALTDVNVETLLALKPDLVLVAGHSRAMTDRFTRLGLRFESLPDASLADIFASIARVGELTQRPRTAKQLSDGLKADLDTVTAQFAKTPPARVLFVIGVLSDPPQPPFVAGPGSFYDDLLRQAGHTNVAAESVQAFGPLSLEVIWRADPDVILELDPDGQARPRGDADALETWRKVGAGRLQAVAKRRVHVLTGPQHYVPGPRIARTYYEMCRAIAGRGD